MKQYFWFLTFLVLKLNLENVFCENVSVGKMSDDNLSIGKMSQRQREKLSTSDNYEDHEDA